ncbi:MAG TPA: VacJ family lipoprotein [Syntrophobacteria bacterium]|nr:VacJ family lipoprotein [Syntrophobacteria bacterium]
MKAASWLLVLFILPVGCVHNPSSVAPRSPSGASVQPRPVMVAASSEQIPLEPAAKPGQNNLEDETSVDYVEEGEERAATVADPLEPFNRAMFHFNDKLYFWVLKPVAQGYKDVVPEGARISVRNFFSNVVFPIRFVNCVLQGNFNGAAIELSRFTVNTLLGLGGLFDPAASQEMKLVKQEADFGQTLGVYGVGQGIFLTWPVFGPSTPRDTAGLAGDWLVNPITYVSPWYVPYVLKSYDRVNEVSLRIGDYEALKEAAIDPYLALRDAYLQYRQKKVADARGRRLGGKAEPPPGPP